MGGGSVDQLHDRPTKGKWHPGGEKKVTHLGQRGKQTGKKKGHKGAEGKESFEWRGKNGSSRLRRDRWVKMSCRKTGKGWRTATKKKKRRIRPSATQLKQGTGETSGGCKEVSFERGP